MDELVKAYDEVYRMTNDDCTTLCNAKTGYTCCSKEYCEIAEQWALEEYGIKLERVSDGPLPFIGSNGCVVPPHLRPLCTLHHCGINCSGYRVKEGGSKDKKWNKRYFHLRDLINSLEMRRMEKCTANGIKTT